MENPLKPTTVNLAVRYGVGVVVCLAHAAVAVACQYTVRDIGFVDLRGPEYSIVIRGDVDERVKKEAAVELNWLADSNARSTFRPGNVSGWVVEIVDRQGRVLRMGDSESPRSSASDPATLDAERIGRIVRERFESPAMKAIRDGAAETFAQILVVEGSDAAERSRANEMARQATAALAKLEPMLPRPLAKPVGSVTVAADRRATETMLLWALGLDSLPPERSAIAVIYGRGKLAGRVVSAEEGDGRELLAQLALVGESCECETDRRWTEEPVLPGYWPKDFRRRASDGLGFDPDSPLVRAEVARIVGRNPREAGRGSDGDDREGRGQDAIQRLLLGYDESEVGTPALSDGERRAAAGDESLLEGQPEAPSRSASNRSRVTEGVRATVVTGDGWGFESDSVDPPNGLAGSDGRAGSAGSDGLAGSAGSTNPESPAGGAIPADTGRRAAASRPPTDVGTDIAETDVGTGVTETEAGQAAARESDTSGSSGPWFMVGGVLVGFVVLSALVIVSTGRARR